ncbi:hypothetical protein GPECTOR_107g142 [Gonium pectorale]|uniref:EF-hand domain-containing protein n=1 Tax=Gonium pectorale TaxID=33097 RepID=A0A150FZJ4_GONPE|nr:hypothetical protein GPECTOR_107g142 [Gonium pectorale]|eukprot:KXZ42998.1 hypothetical protein GPECTOR_107g142 [Gonium pectorale]
MRCVNTGSGGDTSAGGGQKARPGGTTGITTTIKVKDILKQVGSQRRAANIGVLLSEVDRDKDGTVDIAELLNMLEGVVKSRRERRYMCIGLIALTVFAACTIGAIVGLTYAIVNALKDTEVAGGVMYVKGSTTEVVRTGNADFTVLDGLMVSRTALENATEGSKAATGSGDSATAASNVPAGGVLRTATFKGVPQPLSSRVSIQALMELRTLYIKGAGDVEVCLLVTGVARVPMAGSVWGNVVRIVTTAGTISLDDTAISFSDQVVNIFAEAGFRISRDRRMLLGFYEILGFFNFIEIYEPCVLPENTTLDRCVYVPPEETEGRRRRHRQLATRPYHRSMQDASTAATTLNATEDLAGVELLEGVRYMTHNETAIMWEGVSRTEYTYALAPLYRKVEVVRPSEGAGALVLKWQELVVREGFKEPPGRTSFCGSFELPATLLSERSALRKEGLVNFTYMGLDTIGGGPARHFKLTVRQPDNSSSASGSAVTVPYLTVNYWDTISDQKPLAFEFDHPAVGKITMYVTEFRTLAAADPEVDAAQFSQPEDEDCPDSPFVPLLSSPFTFRAQDAHWISHTPEIAETASSASGTEGRRLIELSAARQAEWVALHSNESTGLVEWPQWALDVYGGVKPAMLLSNGGRAWFLV